MWKEDNTALEFNLLHCSKQRILDRESLCTLAEALLQLFKWKVAIETKTLTFLKKKSH